MDRSFGDDGLVVVGTTCVDVPVQRNAQSDQYTSCYGTKIALIAWEIDPLGG